MFPKARYRHDTKNKRNVLNAEFALGVKLGEQVVEEFSGIYVLLDTL